MSLIEHLSTHKSAHYQTLGKALIYLTDGMRAKLKYGNLTFLVPKKNSPLFEKIESLLPSCVDADKLALLNLRKIIRTLIITFNLTSNDDFLNKVYGSFLKQHYKASLEKNALILHINDDIKAHIKHIESNDNFSLWSLEDDIEISEIKQDDILQVTSIVPTKKKYNNVKRGGASDSEGGLEAIIEYNNEEQFSSDVDETDKVNEISLFNNDLLYSIRDININIQIPLQAQNEWFEHASYYIMESEKLNVEIRALITVPSYGCLMYYAIMSSVGQEPFLTDQKYERYTEILSNLAYKELFHHSSGMIPLKKYQDLVTISNRNKGTILTDNLSSLEPFYTKTLEEMRASMITPLRKLKIDLIYYLRGTIDESIKSLIISIFHADSFDTILSYPRIKSVYDQFVKSPKCMYIYGETNSM